MKLKLGHYFSKPSQIVLLENDFLKRCCTTKFLVVQEKIMKKTFLRIYALRSLTKICSHNILTMAYFGLVYPHINYSIRLQGVSSKHNLDRVFKLQKKSDRVILNLSHREMLSEIFVFFTLPCVYIYEVLRYADGSASWSVQRHPPLCHKMQRTISHAEPQVKDSKILSS